MPPGVRGSDKRCEKTRGCFQYLPAEKRGQDSKLYKAVQQPDKTGLRSQRELRKTSGLPSPLLNTAF